MKKNKNILKTVKQRFPSKLKNPKSFTFDDSDFNMEKWDFIPHEPEGSKYEPFDFLINRFPPLNSVGFWMSEFEFEKFSSGLTVENIAQNKHFVIIEERDPHSSSVLKVCINRRGEKDVYGRPVSIKMNSNDNVDVITITVKMIKMYSERHEEDMFYGSINCLERSLAHHYKTHVEKFSENNPVRMEDFYFAVSLRLKDAFTANHERHFLNNTSHYQDPYSLMNLYA